eukprot:CAMPEP_0169419736 /NCGR_PEP_ID=MMETSP1017-20121227/65168_1 /TAXON_ID=342587 /ORGANISM="Karlodinium micrum, Strain CCMP2283" /LENGTH=162 /DNA_ID=CAMNT_0009528477 /DNA_START=69 /DNA_END=557 /DNA_ORIENTATION=-
MEHIGNRGYAPLLENSDARPFVYQYAGEIYPTETRTTGAAVCLGSGRIGAMLAPIFVEYIHAETNSFSGFFLIVCLFCIVNFCLIDLLPFETSDMLLSDHLIQDDDSDGTHSHRSGRSARSVSVVDTNETANELEDSGTSQNKLLEVAGSLETRMERAEHTI